MRGIAGCCARDERPRSRTAEQRDEVATPDASCHLIPPARRVMPPNDSTVRSGVPQNKKGFRLRPLSLFSPHAAAYLPCRLHRAVPSDQN
jgi:hypothetical protein